MNALSSNDCSVGNNGAGGVLACGVQGSALANVNLLSSNDCHSGVRIRLVRRSAHNHSDFRLHHGSRRATNGRTFGPPLVVQILVAWEPSRGWPLPGRMCVPSKRSVQEASRKRPGSVQWTVSNPSGQGEKINLVKMISAKVEPTTCTHSAICSVSIGRFTLKAPVGRSMEASSGHFEIKAPVGRFMAASDGRYLTGAPTGRFMVASNGRSCQVAPTGRCHQASNGRFNLKAPTGRFQGASNGRFQGEAANGRSGSHCPTGASPRLRPADALEASFTAEDKKAVSRRPHVFMSIVGFISKLNSSKSGARSTGPLNQVTASNAGSDGRIRVYIGCSHPIQTRAPGHRVNQEPIQTRWPNARATKFESVNDSLGGPAPEFESDGRVRYKLGCDHPSQLFWQ
ncbi:hypothetical protein PCANC_15290 [Puccinia coronata f. sp. avenae]|uniref:Uncharacterized protein n=1 Tax=Puccinia coronata f. sp. avenae TaxID=200324 RepID=A0A2N5UNI6_9BASI|nr:hypothetical protein PCANC_15290 [Puccinia coronata f. sp. avenae]